jgi:RHS repeat-associated protein
VHKNRLASWQVKWQQSYSSTYNDANGNIKTKTDFTSPGNPYSYGLNAGPHAVTGVQAPLLMPAEAEQEISYNSFNKASLISHNYQRQELVLHYGPDEQRVKTEYKTNGQTTLTKYFPGGGLEVEVSANGSERWLHYLPGGGLYVCDENFDKIGMYYVLTDYLGSWDKVISETGTTLEEYSFDPWGRRRNPTNWTYTGVPTSFIFSRGYTGHEMLDAFGLVNMNGRMYDPVLGRMLSPDNYVSSPGSTQAFNRYSYALNNPLVYTDPSGDMPFLVALGYMAVQGIIAGDMAKDTKQGFWGGFAYGFAAAGLSQGVGALIGPVMAGPGAIPGMVNAGINATVSGTVTYGFDAIVNNSPFNWKGWALNTGMAMAVGGVEGYADANNYNNLMGPRQFNEPDGYDRFSGRPYKMSTKIDNITPDVHQIPGGTDCVYAATAYVDNQNGGNSSIEGMKSAYAAKDQVGAYMTEVGAALSSDRGWVFDAIPRTDTKISMKDIKSLKGYIDGNVNITLKLDYNASLDHAVAVKGYLVKQVMNYRMEILNTKVLGYYLMDPDGLTPYITVKSPYISRAYLFFK